MSINVDNLSPEQLRSIVVRQTASLNLQAMQIEKLKESLKKSQDEYEILGDKLLEVRAILSL